MGRQRFRRTGHDGMLSLMTTIDADAIVTAAVGHVRLIAVGRPARDILQAALTEAPR